MKLNVASFFAGVGGIDIGFRQAGINISFANEIDKRAAETYLLNNSTPLFVGDIREVSIRDIPDNVNILTSGFPCQPFSLAGRRKGFEDERGALFFEIVRLAKDLKNDGRQPLVIFLENVKNLLTHDDGRTYCRIKNELSILGYSVINKVINTKEYGNIPQNRERLYIIAFLNVAHCETFRWPTEIRLTKKIEEIIDWESKEVGEKYYYDDRYKCHQALIGNVVSQNTVYQYRRKYVRENKSGVSPTLTANMGIGGHNVPIIIDNKNQIRKFTPSECFALQGFPKSFLLPKKVSDSVLYKQAGNTVSVTVIKRIATQIHKALS